MEGIKTSTEYTMFLIMLVMCITFTESFSDTFTDAEEIKKMVIDEVIDSNMLGICDFYKDHFHITNKNIIRYKIEDTVDKLLEMTLRDN